MDRGMARRLTRPVRVRIARIYQYCWWACWAPLAASVAVVGLVLGSLFDAVGLGVFSAILAALTTSLFREQAPMGPTSTYWVVRVLSTTAPGWAALCAAVGAAGLVAAEAAVGAAVWPLALAAAFTSPPVVSALLVHGRSFGRSGRCTYTGADTGGCLEAVRTEDLAGLVRSLSNAELRLAWCESWAQLHYASTPEVTHGMVMVRGAYLAEFERRDPHATHAWLTALAETSLTDPGQWLPRIAEDGAT